MATEEYADNVDPLEDNDEPLEAIVIKKKRRTRTPKNPKNKSKTEDGCTVCYALKNIKCPLDCPRRLEIQKLKLRQLLEEQKSMIMTNELTPIEATPDEFDANYFVGLHESIQVMIKNHDILIYDNNVLKEKNIDMELKIQELQKKVEEISKHSEDVDKTIQTIDKKRSALDRTLNQLNANVTKKFATVGGFLSEHTKQLSALQQPSLLCSESMIDLTAETKDVLLDVCSDVNVGSQITTNKSII